MGEPDEMNCIQKAMYGLHLMLLFRPFRRVNDFIREIFCGARVKGTTAQAYKLIYEFYLKWRSDLEAVAKECQQRKFLQSGSVRCTPGKVSETSRKGIHANLDSFDSCFYVHFSIQFPSRKSKRQRGQ